MQTKEIADKRTVLNNFNYIRTRVKLSNVMPYGDFRVGRDKLSDFIGQSVKSFSKSFNHTNTSRPLHIQQNVGIFTVNIFFHYFTKFFSTE